jgi:hypothetical protein
LPIVGQQSHSHFVPLSSRVSKPCTFNYNIIGRVQQTQNYRYNITLRMAETKILTYVYNILVRVGTPIAIQFDGIDDSISLGNNISINNLDDFTISVWIYPTSFNAASTPYIFIKRYPTNNGFILYFTSNSYILNFRVINNTGIGLTANSFIINNNGPNRWYHLAVTFNRTTGLMQLIVDRTNKTTGTNTGGAAGLMGGTDNMGINSASGSIKWGGYVKDFRLFRSELSQADIDKIYFNTVDAPFADYWLKMDEGIGNPVDSVSHSFIGTLVNGAAWTRATAPFSWLGQSQRYIYNILKKVSLLRTYRYNIVGRILRTATYRYNIIKRIVLSRTLKYNILQKVGVSALYFDGINDYVQLGNDATLWSQALTKFSFTFWIYQDVVASSPSDDVFVNHGNLGTFPANRFVCSNEFAGHLTFIVKNAANATIFARFSNSAVAGIWQHIACVYDNSLGSANVKIYVNGVLGSITGNLTETINLAQTLQLGDNTQPIQGKMKDFRWFTTKALTLTEINDIRNNIPQAPTPDYWLKMNEQTGNPIDTISGTKTGVLNLGAKWLADAPPSLIGKIQRSIYNIIGRTSLSRIYRYAITGRLSLVQNYLYNILVRVGTPTCIHFDGVDDFIDCGTNSAIDNLDDFSIAVWIYPSSNTGSTPNIFTKRYAVNNSFILYFNPASYTLTFRTVNNAGGTADANTSYINTNGPNKWYHVVCTFKRSTGLMTIFIDKVSRVTASNGGLSANIIGGTSVLFINSGGTKWSGNIRDFRLYRSALVQADIDKIYANTSDAPVPNYWLKMDEQKGTIATDSISNSFTATLQNGASWITTTAPVVWLAKTQKYIYNIFKKILFSRTYKYNILVTVFSSKTYRYNIINKIAAPLSQTYRYNILQKIGVTRQYIYKIIGRVLQTKIYRYNILQKIFSQKIYRYNILRRILTTRTYNYKILQKIASQFTYRYKIVQRILSQKTFIYKIIQRIFSEFTYRYRIKTPVPVSWSVAGKLTDFQSRLDGMIINYIIQNWSPAVNPPMQELNPIPEMKNQNQNINIGNYDYDKFRSYYIRVKEQPARIVNKVRPNLMEFNQVIEFKISVRKLSRGEAFSDLQKIMNELIRIWMEYQYDQVWGIQAVSFESITPLQNKETITMNQSNKTVWEKTLKIILHYHKLKVNPLVA